MKWEDKYIELRNEGLKDREIAKLFGVCKDTIVRIKKIYGIPCFRQNEQGVTHEQLKQAEEKGLSRRLVLRRVREYGYSVDDAVNTPKNRRVKHPDAAEKVNYYQLNKMLKERAKK